MKLVTTKHIFINSKNIEGEPYDFRILLDDSFLKTQQEYHRMQITLTRFASFVDWYSINETNNQFTIIRQNMLLNTNITIPSGNYRYSQLASLLTTLYSGWTVTYDSFKNKLNMDFGTIPHMVSFTSNSWKALGFSSDDDIQTSLVGTKHIIRSTYMLKAGTGDDRIILKLRDVTPASGYNYDNYGTDEKGKFKTSRILCNIPLNAAPYTLLQYRDDGDNMSMVITESVLKRIRFVMTNDDDELMTYITNFHMVVKVDVFDTRESNEEIIPVLKEMSQYNKLNFLSANLK